MLLHNSRSLTKRFILQGLLNVGQCGVGIVQRLQRAFLGLVFCALPWMALAQNTVKDTVITPQVKAQLMAHAPQGAAPGQTVWVGLQLIHQPEWHTYWKNSGDSGQPTQLNWILPEGVAADDIAWPIPKKIPIAHLANYGYEGTVLLPVPLTISKNFKPGLLARVLEIKLNATWLVCKKECIPEEGAFVLQIPLKGSTALNAANFETAFQAQPKNVVNIVGGAPPPSKLRVDGTQLQVEAQNLPMELRGKTLEFFPETPEVIETGAAFKQEWRGAVWHATVRLASQRANSPQIMPVVLVGDFNGQRTGFRLEAPVLGTWPALAPVAAVPAGLDAALKANAASQLIPEAAPLSLWLALLGAFVGGLILNLMPCVFPILAIKVMGFAQNIQGLKSQRQSALAYSGGVVLSFLLLGALLLGLRSAGEQLGWGFQLQSPAVVAVLALLFTLIGFNLCGLFEMGSVLPSSLANAQAKNPMVNAFLSGVLAVAIASPCTAPFMGASMGLAVGLPAAQALLIFAVLGAGMALPYLLAGWLPFVARALPRPGAWMETFKHLMAFPMFATVVWLLWVLGQQSGIDGVAALLALLVALAMLIWALRLTGTSRNWMAGISAVLLAGLTWAVGPHVVQPLAAPTQAASNERWQSWEPGRVDQLLAQGQPVFVDFTAAWCVTCQVNKKTVLGQAEILADFDAKKVTLLRADWTRRDPAITAALAQLGRNGVPVYVLYQPGVAPVLLSELLSTNEVRTAISKLSKL